MEVSAWLVESASFMEGVAEVEETQLCGEPVMRVSVHVVSEEGVGVLGEAEAEAEAVLSAACWKRIVSWSILIVGCGKRGGGKSVWEMKR